MSDIKLLDGGHRCQASDRREDWDTWGPAIDDCYECEDGSFWAGNGEYGSRVNYCPFCGAKAPSQMEDPHAPSQD